MVNKTAFVKAKFSGGAANFSEISHPHAAKTPRTTFAWPLLHNFTPAVESLSSEMYFFFAPAWSAPVYRLYRSMTFIFPSGDRTADGNPQAPCTQIQN